MLARAVMPSDLPANTPAEVLAARGARRAAFTLVVLSLVILGAVVFPLAKAFFLAAVLAGALYPVVTLLSRRLRNKRTVAAGLVVTAVVLVLVLPITGLAAFVIGEGTKAVQFLSATVRSEGALGVVDKLPDRPRAWAHWGIDKLPVDPDEIPKWVNAKLDSQTGKAAQLVGGAVTDTFEFVFQATMMLIALYALLVNGGRLVVWAETISPLSPGQFTEVLSEFRKTSVAVMLSSVLTAAVQALVAMVGYLISGVPHPLFFTALTFFIAFVPAVGAAGVTLVAAVILLMTGHTAWFFFLGIWGVVVVGLIDNIVKPIFAKRGMDMDEVVIFFSLIGGIAVFGFLGLLLGPLAVAFFLSMVRIWKRNYGAWPTVVEPSAMPPRPDAPSTVLLP